MKSTTKALFLGAIVSCAVMISTSFLIPNKAIAANAAGVGATEQYKLFSLMQYGNDTQQMEAALNALAADGWKVRTGVGVALLLAK